MRGGGPGTNQHAVKGQGKTQGDRRGQGTGDTLRAEATEVSLGTPPAADDGGPFDPINQPYGATPVDEDAREDLLEQHQGIETMAQLNALEAENINRGLLWVRGEGFDTADLLNQNVLRDVHQHMFDEVWQWAGQLRRRELTIGIDPIRIRESGRSHSTTLRTGSSTTPSRPLR